MITTNSKVKVAKDIIFQELEGELILLNLWTGIYFGLDSVGTRIWQLLSEFEDLKMVMEVLLNEYDITEDQLQKYLFDFIEKLQSKMLVEVQ